MEDSGIESDEKLFTTKTMEDLFGVKEDIIQKQPKPTNDSIRTNEMINNDKANHINTCKVLQRKLEMKVEKAKKNYSKFSDVTATEKRSSQLIPINRLPIPNRPETQPLVEYKTDSDDEDHTFFPVKLNGSKRIDISDTFSLQEMTIESNTDEDDDGAQNLELRFANPDDSWLSKFKSWTCC